MSTCFYVVKERPSGNETTFIGEIDGTKATNISKFLNEISIAFRFPDYFGHNYNALNECLNDLDWIDVPNYALFIKNYSLFLIDEDHQTKLDTLKLFQNACIEWANVPNFDGEDEFRKRADFKIYIEKCAEIVNDLKALLPS
jgi:RNAse (barnase) inhibitor barstar